ncbi:UDP-N-acetylmuramoylalanine--D-glutamate ligase [Candidatus Ecksteinia adelgidicola]|nr:UDP-N-acetylmuramoylalanine--D-glutamate ligase [Candidatus Ecksteinia adelgidicola]
MRNYHNKKIVIIGLGITGLSCIQFFISRKVIPIVMDTRLLPPALEDLPNSVKSYLGGLNRDCLMNADLIVVSPGVSLTMPELQSAKKTGIEIIGDIELFCREATAPIVAITGSNGKSTVTSLVGEMAKSAGWLVGIGGNLGFPALNLLNQEYQLYILELSSFQLESTYTLRPAAATILNIVEDHMDHYLYDFEQYKKIKLRIYEYADICIVNIDNKFTIPTYHSNSSWISLGINVGDYCLNNYHGEYWLQIYNERILKTKDLKLVGLHNYVNVLSALALADAIHIPRIFSLKTLTNFTGLPHRLQKVLEHNNVCWINDSKSTNVHSTQAALKTFKTRKKIHLLLGGNGKSADFSSLTKYIKHSNIYLYCFGKDAIKLSQLNPDSSFISETLEQAMRIIICRVTPGDIVLLSPACSSLDQFKNFEERGNNFTQLAKNLTQQYCIKC